MWHQLCNSSDLPDPMVNFAAWERIIIDFPGFWKKLINRAVEHDRLQGVNRLTVEEMHRRIRKHILTHGSLVHDLPIPTRTAPIGHFGCMACGLRCRSRGGEGAHLFRAHGRVASVRHLYEGTQCPACLKEYHTPFKLQCHLRNATACRHCLQGRPVRFAPSAGIGSTQHNELDRQHDGLQPSQLAQGPLPRSTRLGPDLPYDATLYFALLDALFAWRAEDEELITKLQGCISQHAVSWTDCRRTLRYMEEAHQEGDGEALNITDAELQAAYRTLQQVEQWPFLQDSEEAALRETQQDLTDLEQWFRAMYML